MIVFIAVIEETWVDSGRSGILLPGRRRGIERELRLGGADGFALIGDGRDRRHRVRPGQRMLNPIRLPDKFVITAIPTPTHAPIIE
jgi:hypothetical protein